MNQQIINRLMEGAFLLISSGLLFKVVNYFISKDKVRAEAQKFLAEAETIRLKASQELLNNVMNQLRDIINQNAAQEKEMSEMKLFHHKELAEERASCAENMRAMSDRIHALKLELQDLKNKTS